MDEVDRLLVHGESDADGRLRYPSYRELGKRFAVSHSVIAEYAKRHNCMGRRQSANQDVRRRADEMLVELRAKKLALEEDDVASMVDLALLKVLEMLEQGRMRCDSAADINLLVRLRGFLRGNADSRQEMLGGLTLEELDKRRMSALERIASASPAMTGRVIPINQGPSDPAEEEASS